MLRMQTNTLNYYEKNANSLISRYESANVSDLQNLLLETFTKESQLLEIGSGSGRDVMFIARNNYDITRVDDSLNMIEEAKKIHTELSEKLFYKTLPNNLQFNKKFDGIYSIATLMHLLKTNKNKTIP